MSVPVKVPEEEEEEEEEEEKENLNKGDLKLFDSRRTERRWQIRIRDRNVFADCRACVLTTTSPSLALTTGTNSHARQEDPQIPGLLYQT
ncbi:hypothetical protein PoB_001850700 [Plakobranchus ocellatus]|uniref:Uncharacterized protein n=1 Tax=Plakobranchus ocellatus TaxID=259542 RepID=A0AAV3ZBU4_9GAST|nr:hypothetical protein PoB_001850700 [Plakobranchus ocellatus]